jgi:hypothetical protein
VALEVEIALFNALLPRWLQSGAEGKWVVIKGQRVSTLLETMAEALELAYALYGPDSRFIVRKIRGPRPSPRPAELSPPHLQAEADAASMEAELRTLCHMRSRRLQELDGAARQALGTLRQFQRMHDSFGDLARTIRELEHALGIERDAYHALQ